MSLKYQQPALLQDPVTGNIAYQNPVTGKEVTVSDPSSVAITGGTVGGEAVVAASTLQAAASAIILAGAAFIRTAGYATAGDFGGALYKSAGVQPSHPGRFQSADGAWWELAEPSLTFEMFGAVSDGTSGAPTDNYAAIRDCFAAASATGARVRPRGGAYGIGQTLDLSVYASVNFDGMGDVNYLVGGASPARPATSIIILTDGIDGVRLGVGPKFHNLLIKYKNQQADTAGCIGLAFNRFVGAEVSNITVMYGCVNFGIPQQAYAGVPGGAWATASNVGYDSDFLNLRSYNASHTHFDLRNYSGGGTNLRFGPLYINGGRTLGWGASGQVVKYGIRTANTSGLEVQATSIDGLDFSVTAVDWALSEGKMPTVRFEECQATTDSAAWFTLSMGTGGTVVFDADYLEMYNCRATAANAPTAQSLFRVTGAGSSASTVSLRVARTRVGGTNTALSTNSLGVTPTPVFRMLSIGSGFDGTKSEIDLGPVLETDAAYTGWNDITSTNRSWTADTNYQRPPIRRYAGRIVSELFQGGRGPNTFSYRRYADWSADGVGSSGAGNILPPSVADLNGFSWNQGDEIIAAGAVRPGAPIKWRCNVSGSVGTWGVAEYAGDVVGVNFNTDADQSIDVNQFAYQQMLTVPITATRKWTLTSTRAQTGMQFTVYRMAGATGALNLEIYDVDGTTLIGSLPYSATGNRVSFAYGMTAGHWTRVSPVQAI